MRSQHCSRFRSKATDSRSVYGFAKSFNSRSELSRIECYDISHTAGEGAVGSCVVFDESGPKKSEYRRFNIRDVNPGDDYAAMAQVLDRRFTKLSKENGKIPDIILIDGGKGQLALVSQTLENSNYKEFS